MNYIPLPECERGSVYRLQSRNLRFGVFDGKSGFIGIRLKFNSRFLFREYHWDNGPPYGTVKPIGKVGSIPDSIPLHCGFSDGAELNVALFNALEFFKDL